MWNSGWPTGLWKAGYLWINILDLLLLLSAGQTAALGGRGATFRVTSQEFSCLSFRFFFLNPPARRGLLWNGPSCCCYYCWINRKGPTTSFTHWRVLSLLFLSISSCSISALSSPSYSSWRFTSNNPPPNWTCSLHLRLSTPPNLINSILQFYFACVAFSFPPV